MVLLCVIGDVFMKSDITKANKECFGILENVFPMGKEGLREVVPACFNCFEKKACLQTALNSTEGLVFRGEILDRSPVDGLTGWFKKWSERKTLNRKLQKNKDR
jgi:hypothetical protein